MGVDGQISYSGHRHFVYRMQVALEQCGYNDVIPRWDWSLDAADFAASPIWSTDPKVRILFFHFQR